jgi:hypothetical protein
LLSPPPSSRSARPARETWLSFPPLGMPAPSTIDARGPYRKHNVPFHTPPVQSVAAPPLAASPTAPSSDLAGFGQALFGCAPENFTSLDEAQRSRCQTIGALPTSDPNTPSYADRADNVPGSIQWARELARKKAPLLLPCGNAKAFDIVYTGGCIIANIANGFTFKKQYENQPTYSDPAGK